MRPLLYHLTWRSNSGVQVLIWCYSCHNSNASFDSYEQPRRKSVTSFPLDALDQASSPLILILTLLSFPAPPLSYFSLSSAFAWRYFYDQNRNATNHKLLFVLTTNKDLNFLSGVFPFLFLAFFSSNHNFLSNAQTIKLSWLNSSAWLVSSFFLSS